MCSCYLLTIFLFITLYSEAPKPQSSYILIEENKKRAKLMGQRKNNDTNKLTCAYIVENLVLFKY